MKKQIDVRFFVLLFVLVIVGCWRIISSTEEISAWANFTPVGAMASGRYF